MQRLSSAELSVGFFSLFIVTLATSGVGLAFQSAGTDQIGKYPHLCLAGAICSVLTWRIRTRSWPTMSWFQISALAYFAICLLGWTVAEDKRLFWLFALGVTRGYLILLALALLPSTRDTLMRLLSAVVVAGLAHAVIGILITLWNSLSGTPLYSPFFEPSPQFPIRFTWFGRAYALWLVRLTGWVADPNYGALLAAGGLVAVAGRIIPSWLRGRAWAAAVLMATAFAWSLSRGAGAALVVALSSCRWLTMRRGPRLPLRVFAVIATAIAVSLGISLARGLPLLHSGGRVRPLIEAAHTFEQNPWFGVGLGNSILHDSEREVPHNLILEVLTSSGVVGFAAAATALWSLLGGLWSVTGIDEPLTAVALNLVLLVLVAGLTLNMTTNMYFWLVLGLADLTYRVLRAESSVCRPLD